MTLAQSSFLDNWHVALRSQYSRANHKTALLSLDAMLQELEQALLSQSAITKAELEAQTKRQEGKYVSVAARNDLSTVNVLACYIRIAMRVVRTIRNDATKSGSILHQLIVIETTKGGLRGSRALRTEMGALESLIQQVYKQIYTYNDLVNSDTMPPTCCEKDRDIRKSLLDQSSISKALVGHSVGWQVRTMDRDIEDAVKDWEAIETIQQDRKAKKEAWENEQLMKLVPVN